jgi:hypothetical protein
MGGEGGGDYAGALIWGVLPRSDCTEALDAACNEFGAAGHPDAGGARNHRQWNTYSGKIGERDPVRSLEAALRKRD